MRPLGEGSFGCVFLVVHKQSGEQLVMKEVRLAGLTHNQLRRSRDEVHVLRRLCHPNLIAYRESFLEEVVATLYIVMEYAEGGDLHSCIKARAAAANRFSEAAALRMLAQCVDAVAYCHHTLLLLHRDVCASDCPLSASECL